MPPLPAGSERAAAMRTNRDTAPEPDEPEPYDTGGGPDGAAEPPHPINWDLLTAEEAEGEWLELNAWVNWLRHAYGLPAAVIPPFWHRHPELVWELSALHLHWLCAYHPEQNGSAPLGWHRDFAEARQRLRDWVTVSGTRLDRDRPTRQTIWPAEEHTASVEDTLITNRDEDFVQFVLDDIATRRQAEDAFYGGLDMDMSIPEVP